MLKNIILATSNPHKLDEISDMVKNTGICFEIAPEGFNPIENGNTFEENSFIKAKCAALMTGKYALADDAGLCVDALNGKPGIYSARYAPTQKEKIEKLLSELNGLTYDKRTAHFVCAMTLCSPAGEIVCQKRGEIKGHIVEKPKGVNGFGYDPVFFVDELGKTMAEMDMSEKNTLSHRAIALYKMVNFLQK